MKKVNSPDKSKQREITVPKVSTDPAAAESVVEPLKKRWLWVGNRSQSFIKQLLKIASIFVFLLIGAGIIAFLLAIIKVDHHVFHTFTVAVYTYLLAPFGAVLAVIFLFLGIARITWLIKNHVWDPWLSVVFIVAVFFLSQLVSSLLLSVYPLLHHWTQQQANSWLNNTVVPQFLFVLFAEAFTVAAILGYLRLFRIPRKAIALLKPRWRDFGFGLLAVVPYYLIYALTVGVASHFFSGLNVNQKQNIGFTNVHGIAPLVLTFISLVILPPLTEEIMFRGFLYSSLKRGMPQAAAVIVTSLIFASAHLPEGGATGPLYIAALDTFVLSLVLLYLRQKTGSLWASMILHAFKNGIAFVALFVLNLH